MTVKYEPKKLLRKMASKKNVERLITDNLTVNRAVLSAIEGVSILDKKQLDYVAMGVLKSYREKAEAFRDEGLTKSEAADEVLENKKLLVQRVNNATIHEITKAVKQKYQGEYYRWLPSTANEPDPKHRKKWGKVYRLGRGEAPGDRWGCQCGMEILVDAKQLRIG